MADHHHEYYMQRALLLAQRAADQGEVPVGALLVVGEEIIAEGWNQPISSNDPTAHAEIVVLRKAAQAISNYRLLNSTLYVTLEPCTMCVGAMVHARVSQLVYGALEPKSGVAASNACLFESAYFNHKVDLIGGVLQKQCSTLLSTFFRERRLAAKGSKG